MDYEPFKVEYTAGQPYVGATLSHVSRPRASTATWVTSLPGTPATGKIVWSKPEQFSVWSGALTTAGDVVFYGTLEGYLKAVDAKDGKELWKFKTPVRHHRQRVDLRARAASSTSACSRASAAGPASAWRPVSTDPTAGLGAVGGYKDLAKYTTLGGTLFVFAATRGYESLGKPESQGASNYTILR